MSDSDIDALDKDTDLPMPKELREFYCELGDGFRFIPDTNTDDLVGWERMSLSDHRINNIGFAGAIEEQAQQQLNSSFKRVEPGQLRQEAEKRKRWMPFYGFIGSGDVLCLDLNCDVPTVRFHNSKYWTAVPSTWDFTLAASFTDFVKHWSRYHFLSPSGAWTSHCVECEGQFDWAPQHFPSLPSP